MKKEIDNERLELENELLMNCSKAQMIEKYIDELEENSKLSELWRKSQEENRKLKEEIRKYQVDRDKNTKFFLNLNDYIEEEIKYCKEIGFECCVEELEKVLKEVK